MRSIIVFSALLLSSVTLYSQDMAPVPRHLEAMTFDHSRNVMVMYGGGVVEDGKLKLLQETHEFNRNGSWRTVNSPGPQGRLGAQMLYDAKRKKTLLIGGISEGSELTIWFDIWAWDGKDWKLLDNAVPVKEPRAGYDAHSDRLLVLGDASDPAKLSYGAERKFELWELKSGKWTRLSDQCPAQEGSYCVAIDKQGVLTVPSWQGGALTLWKWKGKWTTESFTGALPVSRSRYSFIYSPDEDAYYLYGGTDADKNFLGDLWRYKESKWTQIDTSTGPGARGSAAMDAMPSGFILYGGAVAAGSRTVLSNEVWEYSDGQWKKLGGANQSSEP